MSDSWRATTLGEVLSFSNGRSSPERDDRHPYPVYGSNGVIGRAAAANAESRTIVIGRVGSYCGSLYLSPERCWVTDNAIRANARDGNDPRFLFHLLQTLNLNHWQAGSGQPLLNQAILGAIPTLVPHPNEQQAIAAVLGALDDKIELNRQMNETLEELARAIFKSWFVDFDAVRAKAEGRQPVGMDAQTAALFPNRLVKSDLGEVPEGWTIKPLDEVADFQNGLALQNFRPEEGEERLPVIKIAQLRSGQPDSGEWAKADIKPECIIDDGDIVFSWSASLMVAPWCGGKGALNQHLFRITSTEYPKWFYYAWTCAHLAEFKSIAADKATTMGHIKRHHLHDANCIVPPDELLQAADAVMSGLLARRIECSVESRTLAELRDLLLPKLISGELRIPDAEKLVEDVA